MLGPTKKWYLTSKDKEKPQQDGRRGDITFRIKPHTCHRWSEGSNKTLCAPRFPTETEPDLPLSVWVSAGRHGSATACYRGRNSESSSLACGISPFVGGCQESHQRAAKQMTHTLENNYTKQILALVKSSKTHNRFPNLWIWQSDWEPPGNLTLEASGIWLQNLHKSGETNFWRVQIKPCVHKDPGERSSDPTRDWPRLACECPDISGKGVGWLKPDGGSGALGQQCVHRTFCKRLPLSLLPPP